MEVEVTVKGMAELEARLLELDALGGEKLIRRVLRKIAKPMYESARSNAASVGRSGALYKSVAIFNRKPKGSQVARVAVGSRAGNKIALRMHNDFYRRKRKGIFYGWMLDQGHRTGTRKTGALMKVRGGTIRGKSHQQVFGSGRVAPRPWWTPAVNATQGGAVDAFVAELRKAVDRLEKRKSKTASPDSLVSP